MNYELANENKLLEKKSTAAADFIYSIGKQGIIKELSDLQYISKLYDKVYKAGERGTAYEASIIDTIKELEAEVDSLLFQNEVLYAHCEVSPEDIKKAVEPYPYTHPIRDIPNYAKVNR